MELLMSIRCHHEALGLRMPKIMVTENCCQVHWAVESALPETEYILNMWHLIARYIVYNLSFQLMIIQNFRYVAIILNSEKNLYYATVAADLMNAVLKK
ncbi:hypothetical protein J3R82DRAFT_9903 [Butyriboletus roseoflavus]|nr:hypothetical protein J3R82DRAFT_9903 [Butyriboletus roseoflavus]